MTNILLLEDDVSLIDGLEYSLHKNGFHVETVRTVSEALNHLQKSAANLLLLDITLPDGTGYEVCEYVRRQGSQVPIIFLTASDEEVNIIRGLDIGGDDYITKPFKIGELCSRIRALLRRTKLTAQNMHFSDTCNPSAMPHTIPHRAAAINYAKDPILTSGVLSIDLAASHVTLNDKILELTRSEYRLLCLLVRNAGRVVTRDTILNELWDNTGDFVDDNTLSVYIRRLREKIETDPSHPQHLITVRGFGYRWA